MKLKFMSIMFMIIGLVGSSSVALAMEKVSEVPLHQGIYVICIKGTQWVYSIDIEQNRQDDAISTNLVQILGADGKPVTCTR